MLKMNIIGAGQVGRTIGFLLREHRLVELQSIFNRTLPHTEQAIDLMGGGTSCLSMDMLTNAPITLIATPDDVIEETARYLSAHSSIQPGDVVIHVSGLVSSEALALLRDKGCFVASVHPMRSFADFNRSVKDYHGTFCAVEGDQAALALVTPLFEAIGSIVLAINKEKKALYHAAAVFASDKQRTACPASVTI